MSNIVTRGFGEGSGGSVTYVTLRRDVRMEVLCDSEAVMRINPVINLAMTPHIITGDHMKINATASRRMQVAPAISIVMEMREVV